VTRPYDVVIGGGLVVTPRGTFHGDVGVRGESIAALAEGGGLAGREVIDARGRMVFPGAVDAHTHFALEAGGGATADDFLGGSMAAAAGGVTTFLDFVTPSPGETSSAAFGARLAQAAPSVIDYGFHGTFLDGPSAQVPEEAARLAALGVTSFKLYMAYASRGLMASDRTLTAVFEAAGPLGALAGVHAESDDLVEGATERLRRAGRTGQADFPLSRPPEAEVEAVNRACRLAGAVAGSGAAGAAGAAPVAPLYIFHLTTAAGLDAVRAARRAGVRVWVETCPHYLVFDEEVYRRDDAYRFLVCPPLRRRSDVEALWDGLAGGDIQVVSSDHCAWPARSRAGAATFVGAPAGVGGTGMLWATLLSLGVRRGRLTPEDLARVLAWNPARIFGLWPRKGHLAPGADADIALVDPDLEWVAGRSGASPETQDGPYEGMRLRGRVVLTMARGTVVYRDGEFTGRPGHGRYVRRAVSGQATATDRATATATGQATATATGGVQT
jgi:dihydropyrimidinase